jgi:hypothetical protein
VTANIPIFRFECESGRGDRSSKVSIEGAGTLFPRLTAAGEHELTPGGYASIEHLFTGGSHYAEDDAPLEPDRRPQGDGFPLDGPCDASEGKWLI